MKRVLIGLILAWTAWQCVHVTAEPLRVSMELREADKLQSKILVAAIERGAKYQLLYPYGNTKSIPLSTRIQGVRNGELDIFMALATNEYEQEFQAIYIPIYRGLMGMRLAIVKRENRDIFSHVPSVNDLKKFNAGQGKLWADSNILAHNNIPVVRELKYSNLFRMLEADRFDYFPRGLHEPWSEVEANKQLDLIVEPNIVLWYQAPFYFFVNKNNPALASHLTTQLNAMIASGEYLDLFNNDPEVKRSVVQANLSARQIIKLKNPSLSVNTPVGRSELWYNPSTNNETP